MVYGRFEWDDKVEAQILRAIDGVPFIEGASVFGDPNAINFTRNAQSFIVGFSFRWFLVTVSYEVPYAGRITIHGAFSATAAEVALYRSR